MAVQWVGLVLRLYIVNSRVPVLEARAVDAQLAVLKVRALATSALFKSVNELDLADFLPSVKKGSNEIGWFSWPEVLF